MIQQLMDFGLVIVCDHNFYMLLLPFLVDTSESMMSSYDDPVLNNIQASVFMIDEGIVADLPLRHIRPLEQRFSYLPAQAIHCMLAGVAPLDYGEADLQYGKDLFSFTRVKFDMV